MAASFDSLSAALADRYRLERELGQGGMATVYLAEDLKHHRKVAVKVLRPELAATMGSDRFAREIEIAARLQHPSILPLHDSGEVDGLFYYVMPYVEGETLRDRLGRSGELPIPETVRLLREIAEGLATAHRSGVVHRDIKPENILLAGGHAMVMDFGVAKAVSDAADREGLTSAGVSLGTPAYMAPEQVAADPGIDHRADLYALGLVGYEMLAGGSPYAATTPQQQMAAHVTQPPAPLQLKRPECPPALAALIMRCLKKNPPERWQSAAEIVAGLEAIDIRAPGLRRRWTGRSIAAAAGAGILLVLAGFGIRRLTSPPVSAAAGGDSTVAVMLFDNITRDTAYAYLSDGLASEIATSLARVPRLEVRSPGAVRSAQRGIDPDPTEVGRRLNVRNVVEGEFQRGGDRIRIAVRLVAVPGGTQRWSESWTRPMTDLLSVQEEIARAVATAIAGALLPAEKGGLAQRPTSDPQAYDHFLRGNFLLAQRSPAGVARAIQEYEAAVRLDPSFARAEARIALAYGLYAGWGWDFPGVPLDSQIARGGRAADRALALDSTLADGWMARGLLLDTRYPRTLDGGLEALERATVLDPQSAEAWHQYAFQQLMVDRLEEAVRAYRRALALEPRRAVSWEEISDAFKLLHRDDEALAALDSSIAADAEFYVGYHQRSWLRLHLGDRAGARADADAAMRLSPPGEEYFGLAPQAAVAAAAGDTALARRLMDQALLPFASRPLGPVPARVVITGLALTGQREQALQWLERVQPRGAMLWWIMQFPELNALRADPRFQRLLAESRPPEAP